MALCGVAAPAELNQIADLAVAKNDHTTAIDAYTKLLGNAARIEKPRPLVRVLL